MSLTRDIILRALQQLYPEGFTGFNPAQPTPHNYEQYLAWLLPDHKPLTEAEIVAAADAYVDPAIAGAARDEARAALRQQWDSLPAWIRGPFRDKFEAANSLLDAGDDEAAASLIHYAEAPTGYTSEQVIVFDQVRKAMGAGIAALGGQ